MTPYILPLLHVLFVVVAWLATPLAIAESKFRSPEDGMFDLDEFIAQAYGFVPLVIPITEPAVGAGGFAALAFIDRAKEPAAAGFGRPNITVVGGLGTENGTRGFVVGDVRHWLDDNLQTLAGLMQTSINLDFHGIGRDHLLRHDPRSYNLETRGGVLQGKVRIARSNGWLGLGYVLASTKVRFNRQPPLASLPTFERESRVGGLIPSLTYDTRNNIFTPTAGVYVDATAAIFRRDWGSDTDFKRSSVTAIGYLPLHPKVTLGLFGNHVSSSGDVPFYLHPFIAMRGVEMMRYQGERTAQIEAELRWQFWGRFSVVGFAGAGRAWNNREHFDRARTVSSAGIGFRYELARKTGLHMGFDIATGPDGKAFYIQFGNAWMRP